jgi:Ser/Thr protein kinase RdoA (MazF antagonist)
MEVPRMEVPRVEGGRGGPGAAALAVFGPDRHRVTVLSDVPDGNANWLVTDEAGHRLVLRRHHGEATFEDLTWEYAVLRHLAGAGWNVPAPVGELTGHQGRWYGLTRYVAGQPVRPEGPAEQAERGQVLARLHLALRGLGDRIGPRPGSRPQHTHTTVYASFDWDGSVLALAAASPRLADWAAAAADEARRALDTAGAAGLPVMVVHGDFAEWNVHYTGGHLTGVIDFGLAHLDSRPFELAMARTYRAPQAAAAYRAELARLGWPLRPEEEAAIEPVYRAVRVGLASWPMEQGRRTGQFDLAAIERQLSRSGTPPP